MPTHPVIRVRRSPLSFYKSAAPDASKPTKEDIEYWKVPPPEPPPGHHIAHLIHVPDIRQDDHFSCGAMCAFTAASNFHVGPKTKEEWKKALRTTEKDSTHPLAIVEYLKELGLQVEAKDDMTLEDLRECWAKGWPVIVCCQDYGSRREGKAEFAYGHYLVVIGVAMGYVFCQDPSADNVIEGEESIQAKGRIMIAGADFLKAWHDRDKDNNQFVRFGIAVGPPLDKDPDDFRPGMENKSEQRVDSAGHHYCIDKGRGRVPCNSQTPSTPVGTSQEFKPKVYAKDDPALYGKNPGEINDRAEGGAPIRGTPMSPRDSRIPPTLYHMTTNLPAVQSSGHLRAAGEGGLGGDRADKIVSLTASKPIAEMLVKETKWAAAWARKLGPAPKRDWNGEEWIGDRTDWSAPLYEDMQRRAAEQGWKFSLIPLQLESYGFRDLLMQFYHARESKVPFKELQEDHEGKYATCLDPQFIDAEKLVNIDPANIGMVQIPKQNIATGALVTDFDLDNAFGLKEVRVYGDVPLVASTGTKDIPRPNDPTQARVPVTESLAVATDHSNWQGQSADPDESRHFKMERRTDKRGTDYCFEPGRGRVPCHPQVGNDLTVENPQPKESSPGPHEQAQEIRNLYQSKPDGGFTYGVFNHKSPAIGYAVSPYPEHSLVKTAAELKPVDILKYARQNKELLHKPGHYIGAWNDPATGKIYLDVSVVSDKPEEADKLARDNDQIAYFDLGKGVSVTVNANATSGQGKSHGQRATKAADVSHSSNGIDRGRRVATVRTDDRSAGYKGGDSRSGSIPEGSGKDLTYTYNIDNNPNTRQKDLDAQGGERGTLSLDVLKEADFITLPEDEKGTNCGNCKYVRTKGDGHVCSFNGTLNGKQVDLRGQAVTDKNCCAAWDNKDALRDWKSLPINDPGGHAVNTAFLRQAADELTTGRLLPDSIIVYVQNATGKVWIAGPIDVARRGIDAARETIGRVPGVSEVRYETDSPDVKEGWTLTYERRGKYLRVDDAKAMSWLGSGNGGDIVAPPAYVDNNGRPIKNPAALQAQMEHANPPVPGMVKVPRQKIRGIESPWARDWRQKRKYPLGQRFNEQSNHIVPGDTGFEGTTGVKAEQRTDSAGHHYCVQQGQGKVPCNQPQNPDVPVRLQKPHATISERNTKEWLSAWSTGVDEKIGAAPDTHFTEEGSGLPSDKVIQELTKYVPKKPVTLYRYVNQAGSGATGQQLRSWTADPEFPQFLLDEMYGGRGKVIKKVFYPDEILVDTTMLPAEYRDEVMEEVIVAYGETLRRMREIRGTTPPGRVKASPFRYVKGQGEPCKQGERADVTGCIPKQPEGRAPKQREQPRDQVPGQRERTQAAARAALDDIYGDELAEAVGHKPAPAFKDVEGGANTGLYESPTKKPRGGSLPPISPEMGQLVKKYTKELFDSKNVAEEEKPHRARAFETALRMMTPDAAKRFAKSVDKVVWHRDSSILTAELKKDFDAAGIPAPAGESLGAYNLKTKTLNLDGGDIRNIVHVPPASRFGDILGVYAHEMTHAIDRHPTLSWDADPRAVHEFSGDDEWGEAWDREIAGNLSQYAGTHPIEGFAEFGRLLYGTSSEGGPKTGGLPITDETIARLFPRSFRFFQRRGLWR